MDITRRNELAFLFLSARFSCSRIEISEQVINATQKQTGQEVEDIKSLLSCLKNKWPTSDLPLSEEQKQEIAYYCLLHHMIFDGVSLQRLSTIQIVRSVSDITKIPLDEMLEFTKSTYLSVIEYLFGSENIELELQPPIPRFSKDYVRF